MSLKSMSIAIPLSLALSKSNSTFEKLLLMLNVTHSNKFIRNVGPTVFANNTSNSITSLKCCSMCGTIRDCEVWEVSPPNWNLKNCKYCGNLSLEKTCYLCQITHPRLRRQRQEELKALKSNLLNTSTPNTEAHKRW